MINTRFLESFGLFFGWQSYPWFLGMIGLVLVTLLAGYVASEAYDFKKLALKVRHFKRKTTTDVKQAI